MLSAGSFLFGPVLVPWSASLWGRHRPAWPGDPV